MENTNDIYNDKVASLFFIGSNHIISKSLIKWTSLRKSLVIKNIKTLK